MSAALILAGAALGALSSPHCLAMCGAPCAAMTGGDSRRTLAFLCGRLVGYAAGGAVAAASVTALATWGRASPALRPAWLFLHLAFLALGTWWLVKGRQPAALRTAVVAPIHWPRLPAPARAPAAGLAWIAWPCGVLQGALALAALGGTPADGAAVMAAFALASAPSLAAAPWLWRQLSRRWKVLAARAPEGLGLRVAGGMLVAMSAYALVHGLWTGVAGWCLAPSG
jgi:sulfite exporter TauE/SafE